MLGGFLLWRRGGLLLFLLGRCSKRRGVRGLVTENLRVSCGLCSRGVPGTGLTVHELGHAELSVQLCPALMVVPVWSLAE